MECIVAYDVGRIYRQSGITYIITTGDFLMCFCAVPWPMKWVLDSFGCSRVRAQYPSLVAITLMMAMTYIGKAIDSFAIISCQLPVISWICSACCTLPTVGPILLPPTCLRDSTRSFLIRSDSLWSIDLLLNPTVINKIPQGLADLGLTAASLKTSLNEYGVSLAYYKYSRKTLDIDCFAFVER